MTVKTEHSSQEYLGNGVATEFSFSFPLFEKEDAVLVVIDKDGNISTLTLDVDYSIPGRRFKNGGKAILNSPLDGDGTPDNSSKLIISRDIDATQEWSVRNQGSFNPIALEEALDKLTMLNQECLKFAPESERDIEIGRIEEKKLLLVDGGKLISSESSVEDLDNATDAANKAAETANKAASDAGIVIVGDYVDGTVINKINEGVTLTSNGSYWRPVSVSDLPITIDATAYPNPADHVPPLKIYSYINSDSLYNYTDIVYKASGGNSAVENMIAGNPIGSNVGQLVSTGHGLWLRVSKSTPSTISDFEPQDSVYLADFGAKGNAEYVGGSINGTDDSAAILSALSIGARVKGIPGKKYRVSSEIVSKRSNDLMDVHFAIDDSVSLGVRLGWSSGDSVASTELTGGSYIINSNSIDVINVSGFEAGQLITLKSDKVWPFDSDRNLNHGEVCVIRSISGNTLTLETPLAGSYDTTSEVVEVKAYPRINQRLERVHASRPNQIEKSGISVQYSHIPLIIDSEVENCGAAGLNLSANYMASVVRPITKKCHVTGGSTGYGIQDNGGIYTTIEGLKSSECRRAVDFSGAWPSRFGIVNNFTVTGLPGTGSCIGTHGTAQGITFSNGKCSGSKIGVQVRGPNCVIDNVDCFTNETPISLTFTMSLTVVNCKQDPLLTSASTGSVAGIPARFISVGLLPDNLSTRERLFVSSNKSVVRTEFIKINGSLNDGIRRANLIGNDVNIQTNSSSNRLSFINSSSPANLSYCNIKGNTVTTNVPASYNFYGENIAISTSAPNSLQSVKLDESNLTATSSGSGVISNKSVDVQWDSDGDYARVYGQIEFTASGGSTIRPVLSGMPQKVDIQDLGLVTGGVKDGTFSEVLVSKNNREDIYFAYEGFRTSKDIREPFPNGDYSIYIDITYRLRFPA